MAQLQLLGHLPQGNPAVKGLLVRVPHTPDCVINAHSAEDPDDSDDGDQIGPSVEDGREAVADHV
jgi:hypothetical protein